MFAQAVRRGLKIGLAEAEEFRRRRRTRGLAPNSWGSEASNNRSLEARQPKAEAISR